MAVSPLILSAMSWSIEAERVFEWWPARNRLVGDTLRLAILTHFGVMAMMIIGIGIVIVSFRSR